MKKIHKTVEFTDDLICCQWREEELKSVQLCMNFIANIIFFYKLDRIDCAILDCETGEIQHSYIHERQAFIDGMEELRKSQMDRITVFWMSSNMHTLASVSPCKDDEKGNWITVIGDTKTVPLIEQKIQEFLSKQDFSIVPDNTKKSWFTSTFIG